MIVWVGKAATKMWSSKSCCRLKLKFAAPSRKWFWVGSSFTAWFAFGTYGKKSSVLIGQASFAACFASVYIDGVEYRAWTRPS